MSRKMGTQAVEKAMERSKTYLSKKRTEWHQDGILSGIMRVTAALCVLGVILCILLYTRYAYNSDFSYATNLAREQLKQGRLYPDGWCYSTGFYVFSINLFCIPFALFLKNDVLCRELAMVLLCMLMVFACYKTLWKQSRRMLWTVLILTFLPLTGMVHWYFYDGNYFNFAVMQMLLLYLAWKLLFDENAKHRGIWYICYVAALIIFTNDGLRNQLFLTIPMFLAVFFFFYRREDGCVMEKRPKIFLAATAAGAIAGYGIYLLLLFLTGWSTRDTEYSFVTPVGAIGNLWTFLANVFKVYGIAESEMLSVTGILSAVNGLYAIIATFVIPVLVLKNYKKIPSVYVRFIMLFAAICNLLAVFMLMLTTNTGERLLLPIYFNNILFAGCLIGFLAKSVYRKYEEILILLVVLLACTEQVGYQIEQRQAGRLQAETIQTVFSLSDDSGLTGFLEEHGLTYGYAPYFHALRTASFSDGKIKMVTFENNDPMTEGAWMLSKNWYDTDENSGSCFVLIPEGTEIEEKYYEAADETLQYTAHYIGSEVSFMTGDVNYTILVYDKNIHLYPELVENDETGEIE